MALRKLAGLEASDETNSMELRLRLLSPLHARSAVPAFGLLTQASRADAYGTGRPIAKVLDGDFPESDF